MPGMHCVIIRRPVWGNYVRSAVSHFSSELRHIISRWGEFVDIDQNASAYGTRLRYLSSQPCIRLDLEFKLRSEWRIESGATTGLVVHDDVVFASRNVWQLRLNQCNQRVRVCASEHDAGDNV